MVFPWYGSDSSHLHLNSRLNRINLDYAPIYNPPRPRTSIVLKWNRQGGWKRVKVSIGRQIYWDQTVGSTKEKSLGWLYFVVIFGSLSTRSTAGHPNRSSWGGLNVQSGSCDLRQNLERARPLVIKFVWKEQFGKPRGEMDDYIIVHLTEPF